LDGEAEMSRTATQILQELFHHVEPPQHVTIELIESFPSDANDSNWAAAMGSTDAQRNAKFSQKVADLRKTDANVDWSGIEERIGQKRHIARWLSKMYGLSACLDPFLDSFLSFSSYSI
jgi:hypothetical protein